MTTVEWALWVTNTAFQGVLAYYMIWEQSKLIRLRERQVAIVESAQKAASKKPVEPELVDE
jgi:hypothetical protein